MAYVIVATPAIHVEDSKERMGWRCRKRPDPLAWGVVAKGGFPPCDPGGTVDGRRTCDPTKLIRGSGSTFGTRDCYSPGAVGRWEWIFVFWNDWLDYENHGHSRRASVGGAGPKHCLRNIPVGSGPGAEQVCADVVRVTYIVARTAGEFAPVWGRRCAVFRRGCVPAATMYSGRDLADSRMRMR